MKILKRKVLEIKNTVTEIKNIFDGLIWSSIYDNSEKEGLLL
jgi:hypothetical protein